MKRILFVFLALVALAACQPTPPDARQAAREALENARIQ